MIVMAGKHPSPGMLVFASLVPSQLVDPMTVKEIGPEGGVIELENVARLEIPPGALEKPTQVEIHQVLEVESTKERFAMTGGHDSPEGMLLPDKDFVTPVIRLEPFGLQLKVPATLFLPIDKDRVGQNGLSHLTYVGSRDATNGSWGFERYVSSQNYPMRHLDDPLIIKTFVYFAKQIQIWPGPDFKERYFWGGRFFDFDPNEGPARKLQLVPGQPINTVAAKEIGPEGGVIEIENVALLEISPGALEEPTRIEIHRDLEIEAEPDRYEKLFYPEPTDGYRIPMYEFVTSVVRLEPLGLRLKVPALLYLAIDRARVENISAHYIKHVCSLDVSKGFWSSAHPVSPWNPMRSTQIGDPFRVDFLGYYAQRMPFSLGSNGRNNSFPLHPPKRSASSDQRDD